MDYQTVYDIGTDGFDEWWWLLGIVVGFAALLLALLVFPRAQAKHRLLAGIGLLLVSMVGMNFLMGAHFLERRAIAEIAAGKAKTIAGKIANFQPDQGGKGDAAIESFRIGDERFSYSNSIHRAGFKQTRIYGGPLKDGMTVRLTYVEMPDHTAITKVEVQPE